MSKTADIIADIGEVAYERLGRSERAMTLVSTEELHPFKDGMNIFSLHGCPMRLWKVLMHAQDRLVPEKMCYIEVYVTDADLVAYHEWMARYHAEQEARKK